jgi:transposase-like protein/IS1 family transposase
MKTTNQKPMNPQEVCCPNETCLARGQIGKGNISIHSQKERRYKCAVCGKTFAETKGTPFYRAHKPHAEISIVVILLAYGCPLQAIVAAFGWDERTVKRVQEEAGVHCQEVHEHLVEQPRDLKQVQADEVWVRAQGIVMWLAMAIQVSTRLWLGAEVGERRDKTLINALMQRVRACALCRPLLICVDGFSAYLNAIRGTFREPIPTGKPGRPRLRPWDGIHIAQVVKQYRRHRVVGVVKRICQGTASQVKALIQASQGLGGINTAYIERLNATFRSRLAPLVRRGRSCVQHVSTLHAGVYLVGTVYNFCAYHDSLRVELLLPHHRRRWLRRTPAIAAGITDHLWSVDELLWFKVPKPPVLPKRRGRPSRAFLELKKQWLG